jgi:hypothetical protein
MIFSGIGFRILFSISPAIQPIFLIVNKQCIHFHKGIYKFRFLLIDWDIKHD